MKKFALCSITLVQSLRLSRYCGNTQTTIPCHLLAPPHMQTCLSEICQCSWGDTSSMFMWIHPTCAPWGPGYSICTSPAQWQPRISPAYTCPPPAAPLAWPQLAPTWVTPRPPPPAPPQPERPLDFAPLIPAALAITQGNPGLCPGSHSTETTQFTPTQPPARRTKPPGTCNLPKRHSYTSPCF